MEERKIKTRFISRARYDLFRRLIEQYTRKRLDEEEGLPALYSAPQHNWHGRAYLVSSADERIEPVFRKWVVYRPVPENEREE